MEITFECNHVLRVQGMMKLTPAAWEMMSEPFQKCPTCDAPRVHEKPEELSTMFTVQLEMLEALEMAADYTAGMHPEIGDFIHATIAKAKKLPVSGRDTQVVSRYTVVDGGRRKGC